MEGGYANGYGNSKWAGEVLLREAHDLCGLPVAVFRSGMIMADPRFTGQLNLSDMVTRMIYSVMLTGVAPGSFYRRRAEPVSGPISTGCRSGSSPRPSPRWVRRPRRVSSLTT